MKKRTSKKKIPLLNNNDARIILHLPIPPHVFQEMIEKQENATLNFTGPSNSGIDAGQSVIPLPFLENDNYQTLVSDNPDSKEHESCDHSEENSNEWKVSNKIHCFWDCHPFDHEPCGIPQYFFDGLMVEPNFCSYECALAYTLQNQTYGTWEKVSLLKKYFRKQYPDSELKSALNRESLKIFGGKLSIEEFRRENHNMNIFVLKKPLVPFKRSMETLIKSNHSKMGIGEKKGRGGDGNKDEKDDLVLRRQRPLFKKESSLEITMGLRPISGH